MEHSVNIDEAKVILDKGFARELLKVICKCIAPFLYYSKLDGKDVFNNGTIFFLDTGERKFAVTAYHVYKVAGNVKARKRTAKTSRSIKISTQSSAPTCGKSCE